MSSKSVSISRRDWLREGTGVVAAAGMTATPIKGEDTLSGGSQNVYEAIGVRPIINCRGTFTIISGSLSLPEVKRAMEEAGKHYVHMDELADGVGKRL